MLSSLPPQARNTELRYTIIHGILLMIQITNPYKTAYNDNNRQKTHHFLNYHGLSCLSHLLLSYLNNLSNGLDGKNEPVNPKPASYALVPTWLLRSQPWKKDCLGTSLWAVSGSTSRVGRRKTEHTCIRGQGLKVSANTADVHPFVDH